MKVFAITVALAAAVSAAPLSAQVARASTNQRDRPNCTYTPITSDGRYIILRRTGAPNCKDVPRVAGAWYQVGRGPDNNSIYVVRDANGKIIQRARLNADGKLSIFPRTARNSDKAWKESEKAEHKEMKDQLKAGTISKDQYEAWKKADKQQDKAQKETWKASNPSKGKGKNK